MLEYLSVLNASLDRINVGIQLCYCIITLKGYYYIKKIEQTFEQNREKLVAE